MAPTNGNMVLRTVYLPPELDQQLKAAALLDDKSKNDLIRELIGIGIDSLKGKDARFMKFAKNAKPVKTSKSVPVRVTLGAKSELSATAERVPAGRRRGVEKPAAGNE